MLPTLYRYLTKEIIGPFILGLVTFTAVLLMGRMLKLVEMVVSKGVPLGEVALLVLYVIPKLAVITIPIALLLAVMMAFSRLSADGEITAMKASGISLFRLLPPVMAVAVAVFALAALTSLYAAPQGNASFKKLLYQVVQERLTLTLKEQIFNDSVPGLVIYIDRQDPDSGDLQGVLIQDSRNPKEAATIFARTGRLSADRESRRVRLLLEDGSMHQAGADRGYRRLAFQQYDLSIDLSREGRAGERNVAEIPQDEIRQSLASGSLSGPAARELAHEAHRRLALPFACLVFAIVAMPLGIQNRRSGRAAGFSLSILVILAYYILQATGRALGERELLSPLLAAWLPNLVFLAGGVYFFRLAATEQRIKALDSLAGLLARLPRLLSRQARP
jgi:lipopolysaccharide export system permease protein